MYNLMKNKEIEEVINKARNIFTEALTFANKGADFLYSPFISLIF